MSLDIQKDMLDFKTKLSNTGASQEILFLRQTLADDTEILKLRTEVRKAAEERLEGGVIDASDLLRKILRRRLTMLQRCFYMGPSLRPSHL